MKKTQSLARVILIVVSTTTVLVACSKEELSSPLQITTVSAEPQEVEAKQTTSLEEAATTEAQSLKSFATEDAEKYIDALKKEDFQLMSTMMAHAENENTPEMMKIIIEGFQMHFDNLADLKLSYESSEQNEEYFFESFVITGMKKGEVRFVPFQVKYYKNAGMAVIQKDGYREPQYVSPLINQYPYMIIETEKYLRAILQEDVESLILHLGFKAKEAESDVRKMLKAYREQLDLTTTKVIPVNYNENKKLFLFDFQDDKERSHSIQVDAGTSIIIDDWASDKMNP
jgi:hypothetical protein